MKKHFLFFIAIFFFAFTVTAQPPVPSQTKRVIADKIIAVVGDKIVLKSDIDNSLLDMQRQGIDIPENAKCLTLEQAMGIKALVMKK
jgi:peptidyl-prolyl cis-trans isomerase SurA